MERFLYEKESYALRGCLMSVFNELGSGFLRKFINKIIVELKAVEKLNEVHQAQVFNYLKATGFDLAILANFGEKMLKMERLFNFMKKKSEKSD